MIPFFAAVLPITAMISCMPLLSADAPFCMDKHQQLYVCINRECRTPADLSRSWRHHPERQERDMNRLYGVKK